MKSPCRFSPVLFALLAACASDSKSRPPAGAAAPATAVPSNTMEVVPLKYAPAEELAATLNKLLGPSAAGLPAQPAARVVADPRTNSVIVQASAEDMPRVLELIHRLDQKVQ
jgi:type II secretory pathway component GspD/PulD (secretin)